MISLELFKKIITDIQNQEIKDEQLTNLLICKECSGWVNSADELIDDLIKILEHELNDKYEYITWWLYDLRPEDNNKFVYEDDKCIKYDLNNLTDLYYYIIGEYDKVKQEKWYKHESK